ncbi:cysteine transporter [Schizosaccharomyces cryophilus OY26]|uniref:Cysteine transporter n=1 Tax=Schizosaccharomyces cryophilus (strain OY26 / ATCC MYA-4695 / CBS 11777 / NBRC 106824 / NRRL Y48691) TaxID=653667 RepID=S9VYB2_SCHCR|nr:cysteine transporter [Schizosaccharomyces cryophilus OY26]EPY51244.1 cysteine transporter [Schizosaccharomyces cryophilus OY26]
MSEIFRNPPSIHQNDVDDSFDVEKDANVSMEKEKNIEQFTVLSDVSKDSHSSTERSILNPLFDETFKYMQVAKDLEPLSPKQDKKLRWKLYFSVLAMVMVLDMMLYIDKATLSYSSILGLFEDTHITKDQYNNLNTLFYVGYIIGQIPGHLLLQRFPVGKFVAGSTALWTIIIFLHCTAYNYSGLMALRFFLGLVESTLLPTMEATLGMFFPHNELTFLQPVFYISCYGCNIPAGFIAYGVQYATNTVSPWKLFMIIVGGLTFFMTLWLFFYYPDNPAKARFLTKAERLYTVDRVRRNNNSGIESKRFKKHQVIEALKEPVTWLFALHVLTNQLSNNLAYQQNLLFTSLGVSNLNSTLVSVANSGYNCVSSMLATYLMSLIVNQSAFHGAFWYIPSIAGGIASVAMSWNHKIGELAAIIIASNFGIPFIISLGWMSATCAGYTKKLTRGVLFMIGYAVANIIGPQMWQSHDAPRYYPAWIAQIVVAWSVSPMILLIIRWILVRKNNERRRLREQNSEEKLSKTWVEFVDSSGNPTSGFIDNSMLDLTDQENLMFVYPL